MKALIFYGPGDFRVDEVPTPRPKGDEVLVRVKAASICASDLRIFRGEKAARPGIILGHEFSGDIAEVGADVRDLNVGDRVTVYPIIACGKCRFCIIGRRNRCVERKTIGVDVNGGFAEYVLIPGQAVRLGHVVKLPDNVSYEEASLTEPLATVVNSVETLGISYGDNVLVIGAGPMGLMHVMLARLRGAGKVIVSDFVDERLEIAKRLGADVIVNPRRDDVSAVVKSVTNGLGVDKAVVTVGSPEAVKQALLSIRVEGVINLFAGGGKDFRLDLDLNTIHYREVVLTGTQNATLDQYERALQLIASGKVPLRDIVTHRFPLVDAPKAFALREGFKALKIVLLP